MVIVESRQKGTAVAVDGGSPAGADWVGTWAAAPQKPQQGGIADQTLRLIVHTTRLRPN